jgi:hypothetical protein
VRAVLAHMVAQLCPDVTIVEATNGAGALIAITPRSHHHRLSDADHERPGADPHAPLCLVGWWQHLARLG